MLQVAFEIDDAAQRAVYPRRLSINEGLFVDTLGELGEDLTADNPPLGLLITRDPSIAIADGVARRPDETADGWRRIELHVVRQRKLRGLIVDMLPAAVRKETNLNLTLLHEMRHQVDFCDPEIMAAQAAYADPIEARLKARYELMESSIVKGFGALMIEMFNRDFIDLKRKSPLESRAYALAAAAKKSGNFPRIIRID